jgi:hypothetical protein
MVNSCRVFGVRTLGVYAVGHATSYLIQGCGNSLSQLRRRFSWSLPEMLQSETVQSETVQSETVQSETVQSETVQSLGF